MNGSEITTTGAIESITAKGAGPNSGEIGVSLKEPHQSFWVSIYGCVARHVPQHPENCF
jgi:hypothetical protein